MKDMKMIFPFIFVIIIIMSTSTIKPEINTPYRIEVLCGKTGKTANITNIEDIDYITATINSTTLKPTKKRRNLSYLYDISFYYEKDKIKHRVTLFDENKIKYNKNMYTASNQTMATKIFLDNILKND